MKAPKKNTPDSRLDPKYHIRLAIGQALRALRSKASVGKAAAHFNELTGGLAWISKIDLEGLEDPTAYRGRKEAKGSTVRVPCEARIASMGLPLCLTLPWKPPAFLASMIDLNCIAGDLAGPQVYQHAETIAKAWNIGATDFRAIYAALLDPRPDRAGGGDMTAVRAAVKDFIRQLLRDHRVSDEGDEPAAAPISTPRPGRRPGQRDAVR